MKNSTQETFQNYLSESGLKSTLQRNIILDTFLPVDRHVRVDDLCLILRDEHRNMGHATEGCASIAWLSIPSRAASLQSSSNVLVATLLSQK